MAQPDSLELLDLDTPLCTYNNNDLLPSDSLGGLRFIANSVDAYQSCSLLLDNKEPASTAEALQTASFPDFRIGSEV